MLMDFYLCADRNAPFYTIETNYSVQCVHVYMCVWLSVYVSYLCMYVFMNVCKEHIMHIYRYVC